ncbi:unnamed protein product, partial [Ectocarpus sp. 12 AP-2014]
PSRWAPLQTTHRRLFSMKSPVVPNGGWRRRRKPRYLRGRQQCCSGEVTITTAAMVVVVVVSFLSLSTTVVADATSRAEARGCLPTITSGRLSTKGTAFSVCGQQRLQQRRRRRHQKLPPHMSSPPGCFEERPPPSLGTATGLTAAVAPLRRLSPCPPLLVPEVSTRMRLTMAGRGGRGRATEVACRAVVEENQTSGQSGRPNSVADHLEGSASGLKGTPTLPRAHEGRGEEGERLPDGSLWEGIGEGLSGAFLHAQQGLEGLNLLRVGDAFWLNFGQMDVPELPTLSDLSVFGLSWPPAPAPPPPSAREPKRQPASAAPATTAEDEAQGLSGGGESVTGMIKGDIKTRGLPKRLSVWRRGRPKTDGGVGRTA